jgi:hypothetical protein
MRRRAWVGCGGSGLVMAEACRATWLPRDRRREARPRRPRTRSPSGTLGAPHAGLVWLVLDPGPATEFLGPTGYQVVTRLTAQKAKGP